MNFIKHNSIAIAFIAGLSIGPFSLSVADVLVDSATMAKNSVASVNSIPISQLEYDTLVEARKTYLMGQSGVLESGIENLPKEIKQKLVDDLVLTELLAQEANKRGVDKLPRLLAEAAIQYKTLLGQTLIQEEIATMNISEEDIRQRYDAIPLKFKYGLRAINVTTQEEVDQVLTQLNAGAEFEALANSYTPENKKQDGGWLGWLRSSQMEPQQIEAVQSLKVATFTSVPVKTRAGWRFLYLEGRKELDKTPFNRARDWILNEIQQIRVQVLLAELRQNAVIEIFQPK